MRTNVVLNDRLIAEAFKYSSATTKRELLDIVLKEFVDHHQRADLSQFKLQITIDPAYDYKKLREEG